MEQILQLSSKVYAFSFDFLNKKALWYFLCGLCYTIIQLTGLWFATIYMPDNTGYLALEALVTTTAPTVICFLLFKERIKANFMDFESIAASLIFITILVMLYPIVNFGFWEPYCGLELNFLNYLFFVGGLNIFFTLKTLFFNYEN